MRIWVGLVLIALGVVGLLDAAGVLDFGTTVDRWWPLGLLALAALLALTERRIGLGSLVIGLLSVILLVDTLDLVVLGVAVWGSLAIAAGLAVLFTVAGPGRQRLLGARSPGSVAIFGGSDTANSSPHFEHADVAAVFGAATLDLRDATPEPGATVDAVALFGGVDVLAYRDDRGAAVRRVRGQDRCPRPARRRRAGAEGRVHRDLRRGGGEEPQELTRGVWRDSRVGV
jgi:hypothetical protein